MDFLKGLIIVFVSRQLISIIEMYTRHDVTNFHGVTMQRLK